MTGLFSDLVVVSPRRAAIAGRTAVDRRVAPGNHHRRRRHRATFHEMHVDSEGEEGRATALRNVKRCHVDSRQSVVVSRTPSPSSSSFVSRAYLTPASSWRRTRSRTHANSQLLLPRNTVSRGHPIHRFCFPRLSHTNSRRSNTHYTVIHAAGEGERHK